MFFPVSSSSLFVMLCATALFTTTTTAQEESSFQDDFDSNPNNNRPCTLQCNPNAMGAVCTFTSMDEMDRFRSHPVGVVNGQPFEWHNDPSQNGMHCDCPAGWTGLFCNVPYQQCGNNSDNGEHYCYHGGQCTTTETEEAGLSLFCNCESAVDENGIRYVGTYCEHVASDYCDATGLLYCLNGGTCNLNFPTAGEPCECGDDYYGEHCENQRNAVPNLECDLECQNNGHCVLGEKQTDGGETYTFWFPGSKVDHMYCSCPDNYDGQYCDVTRTPCGDAYCFNGGSCVERVVNGELLHHCDCNTASTETADYAGRACQYKAETYCSKRQQDTNGQSVFCTNGGRCQEDAHRGCICDDERFQGFSCEFLKSEFENLSQQQDQSQQEQDGVVALGPASPECDLSCVNGGTCRFGIKDVGSNMENISANAPHLGETNENFQHCVCPEGFAGLYCDERVDICPDGQHLCFHGSTCVRQGEEMKCDCASASGDHTDMDMYAGFHCEHPVTDICTAEKPGPGQPLLFCVNNGKCLKQVNYGDPHPGCSCTGNFTGPHCEMSTTSTGSYSLPPRITPPSTGEAGSGRTPAQKFLLTFFIFAVTTVCGYFIASYAQRRPRRRQRDVLKENMEWAAQYQDNPDEVNLMASRRESNTELYADRGTVSSSRDPFATHLAPTQHTGAPQPEQPQVYIGPPRDEDGHELHNVDII